MAKKEVYEARCGEYRTTKGKSDKSRILDEVWRTVGGNRDYVADKLRKYNRIVFDQVQGKPVKYVARDRKKGEKHGGGRPRKYGDEFIAALGKLWLAFGMRDGRRFIPDIRGMIDFLQADGRFGITDEIREQLLSISPAHAWRLLAPERKKLTVTGLTTTKPGRLNLRSQVPVCTYHDRAKAKPGEFCTDTVAHCGASSKGQFCKSLTYRDFYSGWLEERALLNSAVKWVQEASKNIKANLPFPLRSIHDDDGTEFINKDFIDWCKGETIRQTRSRPNQKNDNALAEQTNDDAVRKTVGYYRFDTQEECDALAKVYECLCPLYNYWFHSAKLLGRQQKPNGRWKKIYEKDPKTPYERLMESPDVSDESKAELRKRKSEQNPVALNRQLNEAVERLLQINREKNTVKQPSAEEAQD
jgi:hypothetical protein